MKLVKSTFHVFLAILNTRGNIKILSFFFCHQLLNVGNIIVGKVVGKRPFGVFVKILSLVHGRNIDFSNVDIQV